MNEPYTPALISRLLRGMPAGRLQTITPADFQIWPVCKHVVPPPLVRELIAHERKRRAM